MIFDLVTLVKMGDKYKSRKIKADSASSAE
jgi:hypothetical protein